MKAATALYLCPRIFLFTQTFMQAPLYLPALLPLSPAVLSISLFYLLPYRRRLQPFLVFYPTTPLPHRLSLSSPLSTMAERGSVLFRFPLGNVRGLFSKLPTMPSGDMSDENLSLMDRVL